MPLHVDVTMKTAGTRRFRGRDDRATMIEVEEFLRGVSFLVKAAAIRGTGDLPHGERCEAYLKEVIWDIELTKALHKNPMECDIYAIARYPRKGERT